MTVASPDFPGGRRGRGQVWSWLKPLHTPSSAPPPSSAKSSFSTSSASSRPGPPPCLVERRRPLRVSQARTAGNCKEVFFVGFVLFKSCFAEGCVAGKDEKPRPSALPLERPLLLCRGRPRAPRSGGAAAR